MARANCDGNFVMKQSKTSIQARLLAQAQDCLCERDPGAYRKLMLRLGGTAEEAEAYRSLARQLT